DWLIEHALEEPGRVHFPVKSEGGIVDALIMPRGLILELAHRHELFENDIGCVLVGLGIVAIKSNAHRQEIAIDDRLITMAVDNARSEGRPTAFHLRGE